MLDSPEQSRWYSLGRETVNCEKHQRLALEAAEKSIVLLKNDKGILPLDSSAKKISVIGPGAANPHTLFGNYYGISSRFVTILEGLGEKVRNKFGINLEYRQGCLMYGDKNMVYDDQPLPPPEFLVTHIADVSIVVMGLDGAIEGEEGDAIASDSNGDRDYIELPPWQLKFLQRTRVITQAAHKSLILVLTGGSPIAIPEDIADAVIFAWYPGELGGRAVADIIFGDTVPSGKLPITFPASTEQLPPYEDYSMKGRTYRYMTQKPLYPFGFGLSYTSFCFDSITLSAPSIQAGGMVKATVSVSNTGKRDADEVVQIYIAKDERGADDPLASLRAFRRVFIPAGKSLTLEFDLDSSAFETVNAAGESVLLPGTYTVIAADAAPVPVAVEKGAPTPVQVKINVT
jgi:beta-glucosidase